jgi:GT2 family glycosyltransferase
MARVNIIIRAFNRLEYTMLTIRGINELAGYDDYKMIVVDQGSTDGTRDWLYSLMEEGYYKIKPVFLSGNVGDFGGMKIGYNNLDKDCQYVMQWDNDCQPIAQDFLRKTVMIMDQYPKIGQLMLKRFGVSTVLQVHNKQSFNGVIFGDVDNVTCCNMHRRDLVERINYWVTEPNPTVYWDFELNKKVKKEGFEIKKMENVQVFHTDMYPEQGKWLQEQKYPKYFAHRHNINYNTLQYQKH